MRIVVDKAKRRLTLRQGRHSLFRCCIGLGSHPVGAKRSEGDGRTPEGRYYVCSKNPKSKFRLALGISYPNANDARSAYRQGRITLDEMRGILRAEHEKSRPAWDTALGGWIMIHGQRQDRAETKQDWTAGCIALSDSDIEWLYAHVARNTKVIIRK